MRAASALSTSTNVKACLEECSQTLRATLGQVDLLTIFASSDWSRDLDALVAGFQRELAPTAVIGCSGESIVGRGREIEMSPAISVWGAELPNVQLDAMHLTYQADEAQFRGWSSGWSSGSDATSGNEETAFLLADPYSFPADLLMLHLADRRAGFMPILGGMASGGPQGSNRIIVDNEVRREGAAFLTVRGDVTIRSLVSQGCRPVGPPLVVTRAERNVIQALGGKPAAEQLDNVFQQAANREQQLMQRGLQLGRVISEYQDHFQQGDFLVRGVMGVEPDGGLVVSDYVRVGQTVRFHVRDAETADAELHELLAAAKSEADAKAAMLFTCDGRGSRLFPNPHHDALAIAKQLDDPPLAGFFAQGELGPVGGQNFMHGYTASVALWA